MLFRYPALVTGTPRGFRKPRLCVVVREADLGFPSVSGYDAPVAVVLRSKQQVLGQCTVVELPIRHIEGRFYIRAEIDHQDLPAMLSDPFLECPIRAALLQMLRIKFPVHSMDREGVWPQGISLYLSLGTKYPGFDESVERSRSVVLTHEGAEQVAIADALALNMHTHFIVIDGNLWRRVPEPVLIANLTDGRISLAMQEVRGVVAGRMAESIVFPITAHGDAVSSLHVFGKKAPPESPVEVLIPEAFSDGFHAVNYARFAKHLASAQRSDLSDNDLSRIFAMIDKITSTSIDKIGFNLLEDAVAHALAENERLEAVSGRTALIAMDKRLMDFHLDLWDGRTIEIASVVPRAPMAP
jgi:hypothetical protein